MAHWQEGPGDLSGFVIQGRYRLLHPIGDGGMGSIYLAEQLGSGGKVALKVLHPERSAHQGVVQRFMREAKILSILKHPNIVPIYSYGQDDETEVFYLVMEFVEGQTLFRYVRDRTRLDLPCAIQITLQILAALAVAHEKGILHRDLKPGNVMILERPGRPPRVKVLDFGLAKIYDPEALPVGQRLTALTTTGEIVGTPHYMAPEQVRGDPLSAPTDLYAVAVMLYFMLAGRRPFEGKKEMQVALSQLNQPFPRLEDVPPALQEILDKASKKDPKERFLRAGDFSQALRAILPDGTSSVSGRSALVFSSLPVPNTVPSSPALPAASVRERPPQVPLFLKKPRPPGALRLAAPPSPAPPPHEDKTK